MVSRARVAVVVAGILFTVALVGSIATVHAREVDSAEKKLLRKLLVAVENTKYDQFVEDGSAKFRAGITKQMFQDVSTQLSPRMKVGYEITYLGNLNQQGCRVHLWKLVYKDGGDDTLAKLVLKDGKVAGFWLQ